MKNEKKKMKKKNEKKKKKKKWKKNEEKNRGRHYPLLASCPPPSEFGRLTSLVNPSNDIALVHKKIMGNF